MKKLFILCFFTIQMVTGFVCAQTSNSGYKLVFSDEFDLPNGSQPDAKKWNRAIRNKSTWARFISNSNRVVYIKNGCLVCRAIPNKYEKADTAKMLTGAINSKGKFNFQYGKVEVRLKTNTIRGNFPAVWISTQGTAKDGYAEIDIFESFGNEGKATSSLHTRHSQAKKLPFENNHRQSVNLKKWHTYGMEWTPTEIIFTIDGRRTNIYKKPKNDAELKEGKWTFDQPLFLILNQSVGRAPKNTPNYKKIYETKFDWIRVYQKK